MKRTLRTLIATAGCISVLAACSTGTALNPVVEQLGDQTTVIASVSKVEHTQEPSRIAGIETADFNSLSLASQTAKQQANPEQALEAAKRENELLQQQIYMLQKAVEASTPEQAIETWARAVKTRNGALQYAMIDPDKRSLVLKAMQERNWVTGLSSPWLERYKISKGTKQKNGSVLFNVQFDYRTSDDVNKKIAWKDIEAFPVKVSKKEGSWYIENTDIW